MPIQTESLARLACREVIEQSAIHLDGGNLDAFCELFSEDAVLVRPNGAALRGRDAIRQSYASRPATRITRHLVTNVMVELLQDNHALARSYVLLWSGSTDDPVTDWGRAAHPRQVVGEFEDCLLRMADGRWRIQQRRARFVLHGQ